MALTISTYTEPALAGIAAAEPLELESEDHEENAVFAQLLAGLLRKTDPEVPMGIEEAGIEAFDFGEQFDVFRIEDIGIGQEEPHFGFSIEEIAVKAPEKNLSEPELPQEYLNLLLDATHLALPQEEAGTDSGDFRQPAIKTAHLTEIENDVVLPFTGEKTATLTEAVAFESSGNVEKNEKLNRAPVKPEKSETPVSENQPREKVSVAQNIGTEKETRTKLDEARDSRRRDKTSRDKISFEVRDLRTADTAKPVEMRFAGAETRVRTEGTVREMTLELRLPEQGQSLNSAEQVYEAKAGKAFENLLARELHQNFNGDIVRHASIALKDGGEGTIRIALKPESLGNVKIRLEMAENKITGHIVVESEEALNAFRKEVSSLEQAFKDSGFTDANLNLSLAAEGRDMNGREQDASSFTPRTAALRYDDSFNEVEVSLADVFFRQRPSLINVLA
ncbi:MAG: flagellar hook-length control protein FliK [Treponema sp.]|jgi:flagellar hook-length control protein FliK|nr:flagellar hook-length control protein FliK [Treponema sp.]